MAAPISTRRFEQLRELLGDLGTGGLLITDSLVSDEHGGSREDMPVAFRTLVQLDGDICTTIRASALDDPEFAAAHARHLAHVDRALRQRTRTLQRWTTRPTRLFGLLGLGLGCGADWQLQLAVQLIDGALSWAVTAGAGVLGAVVASMLGRLLVGRLIRRTMEAEVLRRSP